MINTLGLRRTGRQTRRFEAARLNATAAAFIGRAAWRMYRGRQPWSAGRWRLSTGPRPGGRRRSRRWA
jgi:hypothetical protein